MSEIMRNGSQSPFNTGFLWREMYILPTNLPLGKPPYFNVVSLFYAFSCALFYAFSCGVSCGFYVSCGVSCGHHAFVGDGTVNNSNPHYHNPSHNPNTPLFPSPLYATPNDAPRHHALPHDLPSPPKNRANSHSPGHSHLLGKYHHPSLQKIHNAHYLDKAVLAFIFTQDFFKGISYYF